MSDEIGTVSIWNYDEGWRPTITIDYWKPTEEYDLAFYPTAGDALNAVMKWAHDRKLILIPPTMTIRRKP